MRAHLALVLLTLAGCDGCGEGAPLPVGPPEVLIARQFAEIDLPEKEFCCDPFGGPNQTVGVIAVRALPRTDGKPTHPTLRFKFTPGADDIAFADPAMVEVRNGGEALILVKVKTCAFVATTLRIDVSIPLQGSVGSFAQTLTITNACPPPGPVFLGTFLGAVDEENDPAQAHVIRFDGTLDVVSGPLGTSERVTSVHAAPLPRDVLLYSAGIFTGPESIHVARVPAGGAQVQQAAEPVTLLPKDYGHFQLYETGWAPDGSRVHYSLRMPDFNEVHTIRPDGTDRQVVVATTGGLGPVQWSPDSKWLTRLNLGTLYAIPPDGAGEFPLATSVTEYAWSPDGAYVAYVAADALHVVRPDGTGDAEVSTGVTGIGEMVWSPDGSRLAYLGANAGGADVYTVLPDGTGHARVSTDAPGDAWGITWAPDGTLLAYASTEESPLRYELFAATRDGMGRRKLSGPLTAVGFAGVLEFKWSPDGSRIAYLATQDTDNTEELYSTNADGTGNVKLSRPVGFSAHIDEFHWLQAGSIVIYRADLETDNAHELYAVQGDGGNDRKLNGPLPAGERISAVFVDPTPGCRRIAYRVGDQPDVTMVFGTLADDLTWQEDAAVDIGFIRDFELGPCD